MVWFVDSELSIWNFVYWIIITVQHRFLRVCVRSLFFFKLNLVDFVRFLFGEIVLFFFFFLEGGGGII